MGIFKGAQLLIPLDNIGRRREGGRPGGCGCLTVIIASFLSFVALLNSIGNNNRTTETNTDSSSSIVNTKDGEDKFKPGDIVRGAGDFLGDVIDASADAIDRANDVRKAKEAAEIILENKGFIKTDVQTKEKYIDATVADWRDYGLRTKTIIGLAEAYVIASVVEDIDPNAVDTFFQGVMNLNTGEYYSSEEAFYRENGDNKSELKDEIEKYIQEKDGCIFDEMLNNLSNNAVKLNSSNPGYIPKDKRYSFDPARRHSSKTYTSYCDYNRNPGGMVRTRRH